MYERIKDWLADKCYLFSLRLEATKKPAIHPEIRIIAALRLLAYGSWFDQVEKQREISEGSARGTFKDFLNDVALNFSVEILRVPNEDDLKRILQIIASRGLQVASGLGIANTGGCKNCPMAWAGKFKGKASKPTVLLEAIADEELWFRV